MLYEISDVSFFFQIDFLTGTANLKAFHLHLAVPAFPKLLEAVPFDPVNPGYFLLLQLILAERLGAFVEKHICHFFINEVLLLNAISNDAQR
ncbi:Uncharacterised protein [Mycobacteroides abscessus subsp. abscessus]|nr:Uncharacterised protein [Mycobacteroides abscessus subsp. abscessus]